MIVFTESAENEALQEAIDSHLTQQTLIIDIDGTICERRNVGQYSDAAPIPGAREAINQFYDKGYRIFFYSSRHIVHWDMTIEWLDRHGFKYTGLVLGKPLGAYYIDDKAIEFKGEWNSIVERLMEK